MQRLLFKKSQGLYSTSYGGHHTTTYFAVLSPTLESARFRGKQKNTVGRNGEEIRVILAWKLT